VVTHLVAIATRKVVVVPERVDAPQDCLGEPLGFVAVSM
jgi:hypothetical protein